MRSHLTTRKTNTSPSPYTGSSPAHPASEAGWGEPTPDGVGRGIAVTRYKGRGAYCAVVAEVEAETDVRLRRLVAAVDVGQVINPDGVRNQIEGGTLQVAFNGRYLSDLLSVLKSPSIALELSGPNSAGVFKPIERDDYVHVIMPMVIGAS